MENLDCMSRDELADFGVGLGILHEYTNYKMLAMEYREVGNIPRAMEYEKHCDKLYAQLPASMKW